MQARHETLAFREAAQQLPTWAYVLLAIGIIVLLRRLLGWWTRRQRARDAYRCGETYSSERTTRQDPHRSLRRRAGIPDTDRRPWAVAIKAAEDRKREQEAEYKRRRASSRPDGALRQRPAIGLPPSTVLSPRGSPAPSLSGRTRPEPRSSYAPSPRAPVPRAPSVRQSVSEWQADQYRNSRIALPALPSPQEPPREQPPTPASGKKRRLPSEIDTSMSAKRKKSATPASIADSDELEDQTRRSLAPPPTTPRIYDPKRKRDMPTSDFFSPEDSFSRDPKRAKASVPGNLVADMEESDEADTESEASDQDEMQGVEEPVKSRGQKRTYDSEEEDEEEGVDEEEEQQPLRPPPTKRGRRGDVGPAPKTGREVGEEWTNAEGDRFRIDLDGVQRKLCAVIEQRFKYNMPRDSAHPARNEMEEVVVDKWLTQEEFDLARRRGDLFGVEGDAQATGSSENAGSIIKRNSPAKLPRDDSIYFSKGSGTPLRPRTRLSSGFASAASSRSVSRAGSPAVGLGKDGGTSSGRLRISSRQRASTGIPLGALLPRNRVSSPPRPQLSKGGPLSIDGALSSSTSTEAAAPQLPSSASAPVLSTFQLPTPATAAAPPISFAAPSEPVKAPEAPAPAAAANPFAAFQAGGSTAPAPSDPKAATPFSFGPPAPAEPKPAAPAAPAINVSGTSTPAFSFTPVGSGSSTPVEKPAAAASPFNFNAPTPAAPAAGPSFTFGSGASTPVEQPGTFSFGAPPAGNAPFVFGPGGGDAKPRPGTPRGSRTGGRTQRR